MRNLILKHLIILVAILSLQACEKKEVADETPVDTDFYLSFTMDGETYNAKSYVIGETIDFPYCDSFVENDGEGEGIRHFAANARISGTEVFNTGFSIMNYHGTGTYTCGEGVDNLSNLYVQLGESTYLANYYGGVGTLVVESETTYSELGVDKYIITGTFSFTGEVNDATSPTKVITNGKFRLNAKDMEF